MLFNSFAFLIFFPAAIFLFFACPHRWRWVSLLTAGAVFYMYGKAEHLALLAIPILINYLAGIGISLTEDRTKRKTYLLLGLIPSLGLLVGFKYLHFLNDSLKGLLDLFHLSYPVSIAPLLLPLGISFYTFRAASYTIDIYRGKLKAERHLGVFALYVSFFPELLAGPIERASNLIPQFREKYEFDGQRVLDGLKRMVWGLFKKAVIADKLSILVDQVYGDPTRYSGFPLIAATLFFAIQIYCDFSGYSDMAIGAGQVMGFRLMENFERPYFSRSISDFWRRWHISLSTWFRDYVYIALGGNRATKWRWYYNLLITFLLSGLWHGANWTFVAWGAVHGLYFLAAIWTKGLRENIVRWAGLERTPVLHRLLQGIITFAGVTFAWIFFRAKSISDAFYIVTHLFTGIGGPGQIKVAMKGLFDLGLDRYEFIVALVSIGGMALVEGVEEKGGLRHLFSKRPLPLRWAFYYLLVFGILFFGEYQEKAFIYFQF
jgi:alginate O-acetyltransferase complex protein AlgI